MVFIATTHECEASLDKKLIRERRIISREKEKQTEKNDKKNFRG